MLIKEDFSIKEETLSPKITEASVLKMSVDEFNRKILPRYMQNEQRLKSLSKTEQMLHNLFLGSSQSKFSDSDVQI